MPETPRSMSVGQSERARRRKQKPLPTRIIKLDAVEPRPGGDLRAYDPSHVVDLAESIDALGLLEPIVIDADGHLLAGAHRLAACKLLCVEPDHRYAAALKILDVVELPDDLAKRLVELGPGAKPDGAPREEEDPRADVVQIPARVIDLHAGEDLDRALAIEGAENNQRLGYSDEDIQQLYDKLMATGKYVDRPGPLQPGMRRVKPAIATILGRHVRTIRRKLNPEPEKKAAPPPAEPVVNKGAAIPFKGFEGDTPPISGDVVPVPVGQPTPAKPSPTPKRTPVRFEDAPSPQIIPAELAEELGPVETKRRELVLAAKRYRKLGPDVVGEDVMVAIEELLEEMGEL